MGFSTDPEFLTLVFLAAAGLAVAYYVVYQVLVRLRIRALGLLKGTQNVMLSDGSGCEVEFKPHRGTGSWDLKIRVGAMKPRKYFIPLPVPEGGHYAKLDRETVEFGRQAFEIGMDWIRQDDKVLEIGSRSFMPIKHGHTGFIDRLARGLGKLDWKLAGDEGEHVLDDLGKPGDMGQRALAVFAALSALALSWMEPVLSHGAVVLDPTLAYLVAGALATVVFALRFVWLKGKHRKLRRKPAWFGDCFWPAFSAGIFILIPFQHLNVKFDSSAPRVITTQVVKKQAVQGISSISYMVQVKRTDGSKGAWMVELSQDDFVAAKSGGTLVNLKFHPGIFGMEWLERATLEDVDRNVASTPNDQAPPPPLGQ